MSNDKLIDRIKKLMMLGLSDPDSPESKSAMEKAAALMEEHNIQDVDITETNTSAKMVEMFVPVFSKTTDAWERVLGTSIAKCFDCRMVTMLAGHNLPSRAFLGTAIDVELSIYFYKFIRIQIRRRAESAFSLARDQRTYGYGCTIKVAERLDDMYGKRQEIIAKSGTTALMLTKTHEVDKFYREKYPKTNASKHRLTGSHEAFRSGMADGNKISINHQVGGSAKNGTLAIGS